LSRARRTFTPTSDHDVPIDGFWMDEASVTAGEFRRFVQETG
jgi:formylglycine-generating enzyme required for sulfatase activity